MRIGFVINARQKEYWVAVCVRSALEQTVPCEILISDQFSTDRTLSVIRDTVEAFGKTHHKVRVVQCPVRGPYGMASCNAHFGWAWRQLSPDVEWIFQLSADDYSLPDRVKVCMEAVEANPCSAVACTMFFEKPGEETRQTVSGYPRESGYVQASAGLLNLAYGSVITAYHREFLEKVDDGGANTLDVYYGFLAALDKGFYVVANPQHVHLAHASVENMGFQGKLRGAAPGEETMRLTELNHFQLCALYKATYEKAHALHPEGIPEDANSAALSMILGQAVAWVNARQALHDKGIVPGTLP